jgi:glucose/arabinose dehydrogenase
MKRTLLAVGLILPVIFYLPACGGGGSQTASPLTVERAFPGLTFTSPVSMHQPPGDDTRWFLIEKGGQVLMFSNDDMAVATSVSADLNSMVDDTEEGGLLGMAFHPSFSGSGDVFLLYTETGPDPGNTPLVSKVSKFIMGTDGIIAPGSESVVLSVQQPDTNHNGGDIKFGPDGFLYIALGDGGGTGDPDGNGQDTTNLYGSMLRIDVDGGAPYAIPADNEFAFSATDMPEIYAWGLRNPWQFSFDELTGDLWVGDVGQGDWEEIDVVVSGGNYGWNIEEGDHCYSPPSGCDDTGLIDPVFEYGRGEGQSVTGGYVYRGSLIPALYGHYIFADWGSGKFWGFDAAFISPDAVLLADTDFRPVSFAEDQDSELYVLDYSGGMIYRLVQTP